MGELVVMEKWVEDFATCGKLVDEVLEMVALVQGPPM